VFAAQAYGFIRAERLLISISLSFPRQLRQAEVQNLCVVAFGYKNISGLNVPMNDPFSVRGVQTFCHLNRQIENRFRLHRSAADKLLQGHAVHKFHHDKNLGVFLTDIVNGADVRMFRADAALASR
jgi:hypothetical protein